MDTQIKRRTNKNKRHIYIYTDRYKDRKTNRLEGREKTDRITLMKR